MSENSATNYQLNEQESAFLLLTDLISSNQEIFESFKFEVIILIFFNQRNLNLTELIITFDDKIRLD